jgi:hypothetical protein
MAVKLVGDVRDYETKMQRASLVTRTSATNINDSLAVATRGTQSFNRAQVMVGRSTGQMGFRMQQAGYQVQDFFVQVGSGTSAMRAFTQQAPQFLGVFGPAGAIAGAALAIGAVVTQIVLAGRETGKSAEKLKTYTEYARELHMEIEKIRFEGLAPTAQQDELRKKIASITTEIRQLISQSEALNAVRSVAPTFAPQPGSLFGFGVSPIKFNVAGEFDESQARVGKLQNELLALQQKLKGITEDLGKAETGAAQKRFDELKAEAEAIIQRNLTPLEKFDQSIKKLDEVFAKRGLLSVEQYNREVARLQADLGGQSRVRPPEPATDRFRRIGLLTGPDGPLRQTDQQAETKKQTSLLEKINQTLERVLQNPRDLPNSQGFWVT